MTAFAEDATMSVALERQPVTASAALPSRPEGGSRRLDSIDLMRGLVMVVMALDHVRDFWHHDALVPRDPTSPTGMAERISQVNRATIMSSRGSHRCMMRPSNALGGPPC